MMADKRPIQVFDPLQEFSVVERRLPHWSQSGTITFITWRTWDSMPEKVVRMWLAERDAWLRSQLAPRDEGQCGHLAPRDESSRGARGVRKAFRGARGVQDIVGLSPSEQRQFSHFVSDRWNDHLDTLHGAWALRRPELAAIVAESLRHFDGRCYELTDFVVMPNHVHVLVAFPDQQTMLNQCDSWKHITAVKLNRILGRRGRFWEQDGFDHLVRSGEQFEHLRRYIADNPSRARLAPGEYVWYTSDSIR